MCIWEDQITGEIRDVEYAHLHHTSMDMNLYIHLQLISIEMWDVCRQVIDSHSRIKLRTIAMLPSLSEPAVLTAALRLHCWDPGQLPTGREAMPLS